MKLGSMDRRQARVVAVLPTFGSGGRRGTGYLLDSSLAITAYHVGRTAGSIQGPACTLGAEVELTWSDKDLDVAILRTATPVADLPINPARLGVITSAAPELRTEVIGYPVFQRVNNQWRIEQAIGTVNPITTSDINRIQIQVTSGRWIDPAVTKASKPLNPWGGVSGAPVLFQDLLIGIVTHAQPDPPYNRLEATPVHLLSHGLETVKSALRHTNASMSFESVELVNIAEPLRTFPFLGNHTLPSQLLDPTKEVVEYTGRVSDLTAITSWMDSPGFALGMLVGEVGVGKTRSAIQLIRDARSNGWSAELLAGRGPVSATGEQLRRLSMLTVNTLIVIDNAELKPAYIAELASILAYNHGISVRLVMLARSAGWWWEELGHQLPPSAVAGARVFRLEHVADSGQNARSLFTAAAQAFDHRINNGSSSILDSSILNASNDAYFAPESVMTILNIHLRALRWILAISSPETKDQPEEALLSNEIQHMGRAFRSNGLRMHSSRLENILAAAVLYGATTHTEAERLITLIADLEVDDGLLVVDIVHDLYPGRDGDYFTPLGIGALSDRLLKTNLLKNTETLLSPMPKLSRLQQMRALTTLFRLAGSEPKIGEVMATFLSERTHDVRFEMVASAGLVVGHPGAVERVLRRAYPSQSDRIRHVVAAASGSAQEGDASAELWDMYVDAFSLEGEGGVDIGSAIEAIDLAMEELEECRSALDDALSVAPSLSNFLEDYWSILYESSRSLTRVAERLMHAEEDTEQVFSLSRKLHRELEELRPTLSNAAGVLTRDTRRLSSFQEEGLSQIAEALQGLADALRGVAEAVPIKTREDED
ncbi:serine protease [Microbispora sp. H10836]|uniref:S1 family peptidase n=1 Tax=Microbispora sp. H10836 TaxID=2729106 RepID=UPI001B8D9938|nr:serine protease [Microbispora sp. H10836]